MQGIHNAYQSFRYNVISLYVAVSEYFPAVVQLRAPVYSTKLKRYETGLSSS